MFIILFLYKGFLQEAEKNPRVSSYSRSLRVPMPIRLPRRVYVKRARWGARKRTMYEAVFLSRGLRTKLQSRTPFNSESPEYVPKCCFVFFFLAFIEIYRFTASDLHRLENKQRLCVCVLRSAVRQNRYEEKCSYRFFFLFFLFFLKVQ